MAKTKQAQQKNTPAKATSINYSGEVTVSIKKNHKIISKKVYKNNGTPKLFQFLCQCLSGDFNKEAHPARIALFKLANTSESPDNPIWTGESRMTNYVLMNSVTRPEVTEYDEHNKIIGYAVTFHFSLPSTIINGREIFKIALYAQTMQNDDADTNKLAYFLFTKVDEGQTVWDAQHIEQGDYVILIDWKMKIDNQAK